MNTNYRVIIQYEGTKYQGWQKQDSTENTIQGKLERILQKMTGEEVQVNGSGRTDAGVHATGQTANFKLNIEKESSEVMDYMNQYLPDDVAIISCEIVADRFHARLNVKSKTYCYHVINSRIPHVFDRRYVLQVEEALNVDNMQRAADLLIGEHDFRTFTSSKKGNKSTIRTIESIHIRKEGDEILFTYTGDGFLYHMVRIITGTLLEIGKGDRTPESMLEVLQSGKRENAGYLVPAQGLVLVNVEY